MRAPHLLPLFLDPSFGDLAHRQEHRESHQPRPRVLVVDDEPSIREFLFHGLQLHGFDVETAADGVEALEMCQRGPAIDVVLADKRMPGLDGMQTEAKLRRIAPWIRFCLMSGSPDGKALPHPSTVEFVAKPFALDHVAGVLWRLVREPLSSAERW
jgi:CheY-like chemotaxis protein